MALLISAVESFAAMCKSALKEPQCLQLFGPNMVGMNVAPVTRREVL